MTSETKQLDTPRPDRRDRIRRRVAAGVSLFYAVNVLVPWRPQYTGDVDDSWIYPLHLAFAQHWQWGRDIAFTYGPWGFLNAGFAPQTIGLMLVIWTVAASLMCWCAWHLSSHLTRNAWIRLLALIVLFGVIAQTDLRAIACPMLLLIVHCVDDHDRSALARKMLLVLLVALLSLCKFTFFMLAAPVVLLIALDEIMRRRIPWTLAAFLGGIGVFWLAADQSPLGFFPYLKWSLEIATHHSDAMSLYGQPGDYSLPWYVALSLAVVAWMTVASRKREKRKMLFGILGLVAAFFMVFKIGYLRRDTHVIVAAGFPLVILLLLLIGFWDTLRKSLRIACVILILIAASFANSVRSVYWATSLPRGLIATISVIPSNLAALIVHVTGGATAEQTIFDAQTHPLAAPIGVGKVDFYPLATLSELASGVELSKRPAWDSYSAFTSALLQLDAAHLVSSAAPDTIFFDVDPIDHRFPSQDDSLSWPQLLTRYQPTGTWNNRLVLTRRATPLKWHTEPRASRTTTLKSWIDLPQTDPLLWVTIDVKPNTRHALAETFYRPHELWMNVELNTGEVKPFRLIPDIIRAGFLLSPLVESAQDFSALYSKPDSASRPKRIQLEEQTFGGAAQFDPQFTLHFSRLVIEPN